MSTKEGKTLPAWNEAGVVSTVQSPHAILRPVPIQAVTMEAGFWRPRMEASRRAGIPAFLSWLDRDDQISPFRTFSQSTDGPEIGAALEILDKNYRGQNKLGLSYTWRANATKWLEACAFVLQSGEDDEIRGLVNDLAAGFVAAHQNEDFFNIYYGENFELSYGLATPGHLIQTAIAHHRATGEDKFLECAMGVADRVCAKFGGEEFAGHPAIEMALVELYRSTGDERYLRGAEHFLTPLLRQPPVIGPSVAIGSNVGVRRSAHLVRQTYLMCGGADSFAETGNKAYLDKLVAIWNDVTAGKMHIVGSIAVRRKEPEVAVEEAFDLSQGIWGWTGSTGMETCATVGNAYWNWRMLAVTGEAAYADLFECLLYNGILAGVSLDHGTFSYLVPLASLGDHPPRTTWASLSPSCCPPNLLRTIASIPGYIFSTSDSGFWVHLYDNCRVDWRLSDGTAISLRQQTRYPWEGAVALEVSPERPATFDLNLRIPGWCTRPEVKVNGANVRQVAPGSYCRIRRAWKPGDRVILDLPMPVVGVQADPRVKVLRRRLALMRGPLVYCFEGADNPGLDLWEICVGTGARSRQGEGLYAPVGELPGFETDLEEGLLGQTVVLRGEGGTAAPVTAIPFYAWGNRGASPFLTWVGAS